MTKSLEGGVLRAPKILSEPTIEIDFSYSLG